MVMVCMARRATVQAFAAMLFLLTVAVVPLDGVPAAAAPRTPAVSSVSPAAGGADGGTRVSITGARFTRVSKVLFGSTPGKSLAVASATSLSVTAPSHVAGAVHIRVVTAYGTSPVVSADRFTYMAAPTVTKVSPGSGAVGGGARVTISGSAFVRVSKVLFGSTPATGLSVNSATSLSVTAPSGVAGAVDVRVVSAYGISRVAAAAKFTYLLPPSVTGVAPASGSTSGGSRVVVKGAGFTGVSKVLFGSAAGTSLTMASAGSLTVTAPPQSAGVVDVQVVTDHGKSPPVPADRFTYVAPAPPAPTVTAVSPSTGPETGGTRVTITGTGLSRVTRVDFGTTAGLDVTPMSDTQVAVTAPSHAPAPVDVRVVSPDGISAAGAAARFTYQAQACQPVVRHITGTLTSADAAWSPACASAYVLDQTVVVPAGVTLSIAAGSVVKGAAGAQLVVAGRLVAAGTSTRPVVLTSLRDDSVGGDTNADGQLTTPKTSDWNGVVVRSGAAADIDQATLRYTVLNSEDNVAQFRLSRSEVTAGSPTSVGQCQSGEVVSNTFTGSLLRMQRCSIPVRNNRFVDVIGSVSITGHDDLALVALAGAQTNTFAGRPVQVRVNVSTSRVRAGSDFAVHRGSGVVLHPDQITVEGTVTLHSGIVVKSSSPMQGDKGSFMVRSGGLLRLLGTAEDAVTVTSTNDDSVGGDTNGNGPSDPAQGVWASGFATINGGSIQAYHAVFTWLVYPIAAEYGTVDELTIRESVFSTPSRIHASGLVADGNIDVRGCRRGEVTGNRFAGTRLGLWNCSVPIHGNRFSGVPQPLTVLDHDDLAQVVFAGGTANTFTGTGDRVRVHLRSGQVRAGTEFVADPATGAVLEPLWVQVRGIVTLRAGSVVKTDAEIQNRGGAFSVQAGGLVRLTGTQADPVTVTSMGDDSIAGDTGGDGISDPSHGWWGSGFVTLNGGSLRAEHAVFRWLVFPIISEYEPADELTIRDSVFATPSQINANGIIVFGNVSVRGCRSGDVSSNRFAGTSLTLAGCSVPVTDNQFQNTVRPLTLHDHDDLAAVDLAGTGTNIFTGSGAQRRVTIYESTVADGSVLAVNGLQSRAVLDLQSPIKSSHSLLSSPTGSVALGPGSVLKAQTAMFDLGPNSDFTSTGTSTAPVVFTSSSDDTVAGDTNGDGAATASTRFDGVFKTDQAGDWALAAGALGLDLQQVGPGTATVKHAVVRHAAKAFAGCLVCRLVVNETDFLDVTTGVSQSFYQLPLAPCVPVMGREIVDGGIPVWRRANARNNYWGGPGGPSTDVNLVEIGLSYAGQRAQFDNLVAGLPLEDANVVQSAVENMAAQTGDSIPNFDLTGYAAAAVSVQTCTVPVLNVTFPVIVIPEDFADAADAPIHDLNGPDFP